MTPKHLIIVRKSNAYRQIFYAKGRLNLSKKKYDELFVAQVKQVHEGIKSVQFNDNCSVSVTIYVAFTDDWAKIERLVFKMICGQLGWTYKSVEIRRQDSKGGSEDSEPEYFRVAKKKEHKAFINGFLEVAYAEARNTPQ